MTVAQKGEYHTLALFRRMLEFSLFNTFWIPDQVRHDVSGTFCEFVKI